MDSPHPQESSTLEESVVYVEDLAGPDDYWLSITDAARVCRVQDVSIRRAINRKSLPVRRQRAGQNKRTRFVRASDLALAGFPIIDESAAITTEIGKVDVLSIPRQQQQIVQEHQALLRTLDEIQAAFTAYQHSMVEALCQQKEQIQGLLGQERAERERVYMELETRRWEDYQKLQHASEEMAQRVATAQQALHEEVTRTQTNLRISSEQAQSNHERLRLALTQFQQESEQRAQQVQEALQAQQRTIRANQEAHTQALQQLTEAQQNALTTYQRTIDARIQHLEQTGEQRLVEFEQRFTHELRQYAQRFEVRHTELEQRLADMQKTNTAFQQRMDELTHQQLTQQDQIERLMPLLPYTHQRLLGEKEKAALEERLQAIQQELVRYQPLLPLLEVLSPDHTESLKHLLIASKRANPEENV